LVIIKPKGKNNINKTKKNNNLIKKFKFLVIKNKKTKKKNMILLGLYKKDEIFEIIKKVSSTVIIFYL